MNFLRTLTIIVLLLFTSVSIAQQQNAQRLIHDLSGHLWKLQGTLPGRGMEEKFPEISYDHMGDALNWAPAQVPGDVFTDLWRIGRIEDPHFGRNSVKAKWVNEYEWWYLRIFNVPKEMEGKNIELNFEGVDYACDVYLNGILLGSHEGMFTPFSFDITKLISLEQYKRGRNVLAVRLHPAPRRYSQVAGKKPAWHGDYWVDLVPTGIWKPVKLMAYDKAKIDQVYVETKVNLKKQSADLDIHLEIEHSGTVASNVELEIEVQGENFKSKVYKTTKTTSLKPGKNELKIPLTIADAKLWYPWDLGDQNLYIAKITVKNDNKVLDANDKLFGIRELKMEMNLGFTKQEVENPWTVMINGKRHFIRSGTWGGPPDIFFGRATKEKYQEFIRLAKSANFNNLRIFGWHPTEIEYFYELCNREGITVWQDILPIASLSLPKGEAYKKSLFADAISVVKQLRNHPCMVIIEGGEEILMTASDPVYNLNFMKELGEVVKPYSNLHYVPVSPLSDHVGIKLGFKPNESVHANGLFYSEGRINTEKFFNKQNFAVVPELAISSCPNVSSIKKFIPENELWPPGPSWGHHWTDFDVFRTLNFDALNTEATGSMQEFVDATQIAQGVIFQYGLEYYRRRKPKSSAISICHFITFAPDMKWGIVDYYQQPKLSYDYVKRAYQPVLVSLEHERRRWLPAEQFEGKIWVVNDLYQDFKNCKAEIIFMDNNHKEVKRETFSFGDIKGDSATKFVTVNCKVPGKLGDKFYVNLSLKDVTGKAISENKYLLLVGDEKVDLPKLRAIGQEAISKKEKYGSHNYLRYFESLNGAAGVKQADEKQPFVKEFDNK
ncbi:sugar-binding domain-containing protein [Flavobacterium sp. UMI-01]|uniref:glycoside hydrolase family 2 protein n=1 Tax=Flavobacterium sp. UMI-01 TaxID=1441053 RepID=UPI001C7D42C9|nr:sugar-binding domain-containing protein [Flavobacterium sp. UMI-01]GIZ09643.1 beta-mannosidase [Flavobacterium sp. UMI-01]